MECEDYQGKRCSLHNNHEKVKTDQYQYSAFFERDLCLVRGSLATEELAAG